MVQQDLDLAGFLTVFLTGLTGFLAMVRSFLGMRLL